jgi:hypothetical protein
LGEEGDMLEDGVVSVMCSLVVVVVAGIALGAEHTDGHVENKVVVAEVLRVRMQRIEPE